MQLFFFFLFPPLHTRETKQTGSFSFSFAELVLFFF